MGVLCNNASLPDPEDPDRCVGDPLEIALQQAGRAAGIVRDELLAAYEEVREVSFDPDLRMMATYHRSGGGYFVAVKGAPSAVLDASRSVRTEEGERDLDEAGRTDWAERADRWAREGLRVLALARKDVSSSDAQP